MGDCQERKLTDVIENLPAHSRDFSREVAGRIHPFFSPTHLLYGKCVGENIYGMLIAVSDALLFPAGHTCGCKELGFGQGFYTQLLRLGEFAASSFAVYNEIGFFRNRTLRNGAQLFNIAVNAITGEILEQIGRASCRERV